MSEENKFENALIKDVLQAQFQSTRTKINEDALNIMSELAKIIVTETTNRAIKIAKINPSDNKKVTLDHIETILPQIMLDLP